MENSKSSNDNNETKIIHVAEENPNPDIPTTAVAAAVEEQQQQQQQGSSVLDVVSNGARQLPSRTPFTNLSQVDADLALARTLQEQERAYMVLRMNGDGSDYGSWETGSYDQEDEEGFDDPSEEGEYAGNDDEDDENEEDAFDVHAHYEDEDEDDEDVVELDPASFPDDESYARALQDIEEREMAERLLALAGISNHVVEAMEDHGHNSQETWDDIDPDELSYEELIALGEMVGTESRGLSVDTIASLPSVKFKAGETQNGCSESCVICRLDFEEDETLTLLSCKHSYHSECINNWLRINKVCPVCSTEVSSSGPAT
ncbi:E3 ubiquitin ligase BIG BROTHER-related [Impatiens glandulifera]|uniref:E3 ubiquitin ligase BIG BROTHER-related n=1 Tax=Impatiens glandulifera TaxID=253017 RepID=UPI001FB11889|nr:E3 ubiquitin ligase BIG BROTHER-related [Impatiens glandulifera]